MAEQREQHPMEPARAELLSRAARAARELCELLWEAMHEELRDPREDRVRALSERLSEVSSTVAMLTVGSSGGAPSGERRRPPQPVAGERPGEPEPRIAPVPVEPVRSAPARSEPVPPVPAPAAGPSQPAAPPGHAPGWSPPSPAPIRPEHAMPGEQSRIRLVDEHGQAGPVDAVPVRREQGASAWVDTVGKLLQRHAVDGLPFAVLLVEVVDVARIERSESPVQLNNLIAQVEEALGRALRAEDTLTRESFGRYWLVAPETNGTGAQMLAERLARLVRSSASHRGVPLEVAVGIAVCPEDGTEAPTLAARADLGVFSARANGRTVARTDPPA